MVDRTLYKIDKTFFRSRTIFFSNFICLSGSPRNIQKRIKRTRNKKDICLDIIHDFYWKDFKRNVEPQKNVLKKK